MGISVTSLLRLLLVPLGLGSCTVNLRIRIIRGSRLIPWPAVIAAIHAVIPTRFVAIATIATGRLGPRGRGGHCLLDSHRSRLVSQI